MSKIALDMMGGDFAPLEAVKGFAHYLSTTPQPAHLILVGNEAELLPLLKDAGIAQTAYQILPSTEVIGMQEHPTKALKEKPDSSIAKGFAALLSGEADAFISAGNTGAMMVGALFSIKALPGVNRPSIGAYMPRQSSKLGLLIDVGLNADSKPENLEQNGVLGSLFAEYILDIKNPKVGLVNIGEEEGKGNLLTQASYPLLKANTTINFIGNIEGRDILTEKADVLVCDGFTGNVVLKLAESIYDISLSRKINDAYFTKFNFEAYGGVPVLGVAKPVIIGHGISGSHAFANMIITAQKMLDTNLCSRIAAAFA